MSSDAPARPPTGSPASAPTAPPFQFGNFMPGYDFLQKLSTQAQQAQPMGFSGMPGAAGWVTPGLSPEEIDKRINELKTVQFWLDQNSRLLTATVQALEVQKMTLATLAGMNLAMGDIANAFRIDPAAFAAPASSPVASPAAAAPSPSPAPGVVDPVQWWGALTQQFQTLAAQAMASAAVPPDAASPGAPAAGAAPAPSPKPAKP